MPLAHLSRTPIVGKTVTYFEPITGKRRPAQVIAVYPGDINTVDLRLADGTTRIAVPRSVGRQGFGSWGFVRGRSPGSGTIGGISFNPYTNVFTSGKLKAAYDVSQSSGITLVSDDFTRTPAAGTTIVSDTFTRLPVVSDDFSEADGTNLNGKATDTGQTWIAGSATVQSGKLVPGAAHDHRVQTGLADVAVNADISYGDATATRSAGVVFRYVDASNYLSGRILVGTNTGIYKIVAGAYTSIAGGAIADVRGTTKTISVRAIGSSISLIVDGTVMLSVTDSFNATATMHGLDFRDENTASGTVSKADNFSVTRADLGTAETGQTWTSTATAGTHGIDANGYAGNFTGNAGIATVDAGMADVDITLTIKTFVNDFGIVWRYQDDNNMWLATTGGIYKRVAGVYTPMSGVPSYANNDVIRIILIGNTGQFYKNGVLVSSWTDSQWASNTKVGFYTTSSGARIDNFSVKSAPTGVSDDFSEVDGTSLSGKTTDTGQVWQIQSGTWKVNSSGRAYKDVGGDGALAFVEAGFTDQFVTAEYHNPNSFYGGIIARYADFSNFYFADSNGSDYRLFKYVGGAITSLSSGATVVASGAQFGLRVVGSTLTVERNGAVLATVTDSSLTTGTKAGFRSGGGAPSTYSWDNFSVTRADLGFATGINGQKVPWVELAGDWGIDANGYAYATASGARFGAYVDTKSADFDMSVTIPATHTAGYIGLGFRIVDASNRWYLLQGAPGVDNNLYLQKYVAGVETNLSTFGRTLVAGDVLRVLCVGSSVKVYVNGTLTHSQTDAAHSTATRHGLHAHNATGGKFDTFSIKTPTYAAGDGIGVLPDLSGNGNHAVQTTAANQPKYGFGTVTDDFSEANGTNLNGKLTDTSQAWSVLTGAWAVTGAALPVDSTSHALAVVETGMPDAVVGLSITQPTNGDASIAFRATDANNFWAAAVAKQDNNVRLYKRVAGAYTLVSTSAVTVAATAESWTVTAKGSSLVVARAGITILTTSDSAHSAATKHGVANGLAYGASAGATFDNFSVTSLAGGKAVGVFDGSNDTLSSAFTLAQPVTVFVVARNDGSATNQYFVDGGAGTNNMALSNSASLTTIRSYAGAALDVAVASGYLSSMHLLAMVQSGAYSATYSDGGILISGNTGTNSPGGVTIGGAGAGGGGWLKGDIAQVYVFEGRLSYAERKQVETYLQARFSTPALAA